MRYVPLLVLLVSACSPRTNPPKRWFLGPELAEISGLGIRDQQVYAHNDSGDGPFLYRMPIGSAYTERDRIAAAARDYEDLTSDPAGNWYIGDFGNNRRQRDDLRIYRYHPATKRTDTIHFTYAFSSQEESYSSGRFSTSAGGGIAADTLALVWSQSEAEILDPQEALVASMGRQHDCEAMVYLDGQLHLFTKAKAGQRRQYWTYHYRLPAQPGYYTAELVDSLYLNHRVVTGADIDSSRNQLLLTSYNYKQILGFFPTSASSLIQLSDYSEDRFFEGRVHRRNLSWAVPNQVEAVAYYDDRFFYIGRERTPLARARIKRKRRF
ncbi:MAG: hypothetical protein AAF433_07260 [Bacteroidota bacterium]